MLQATKFQPQNNDAVFHVLAEEYILHMKDYYEHSIRKTTHTYKTFQALIKTDPELNGSFSTTLAHAGERVVLLNELYQLYGTTARPQQSRMEDCIVQLQKWLGKIAPKLHDLTARTCSLLRKHGLNPSVKASDFARFDYDMRINAAQTFLLLHLHGLDAMAQNELSARAILRKLSPFYGGAKKKTAFTNMSKAILAYERSLYTKTRSFAFLKKVTVWGCKQKKGTKSVAHR